ncbi:MAG TPA: hypothetical protein DF984_05210 [Anaerolineaceae bacterium]|nr:hypothetical protein [Anaerolineaceae bacterium]
MFIPGMAVGGSRTTTWQIGGREDVHLCHICFPIPDGECGARKAIEAKKELLQMQGYDSFFTPAEYKSLST